MRRELRVAVGELAKVLVETAAAGDIVVSGGPEEPSVLALEVGSCLIPLDCSPAGVLLGSGEDLDVPRFRREQLGVRALAR